MFPVYEALAINVINRKVGNYCYHNPKKGLVNNLMTKFTILKTVSRYYVEEQTEAKNNTFGPILGLNINAENMLQKCPKIRPKVLYVTVRGHIVHWSKYAFINLI